MSIRGQNRTGDVPAGPGLGLKRHPFGLVREPINRLELVLAMRGGAVINVFDKVEDEVTEERLDKYLAELAEQIREGRARLFSDAWSATGQKAWVDLGEVTGFTVRLAK